MQVDTGREAQIVSLFEKTLKAVTPLVRQSHLTGDEQVRFEQSLSTWFRRLTQRPGYNMAPVKVLEGPLLLAARHYVSAFHEDVGVPAASDDETVE